MALNVKYLPVYLISALPFWLMYFFSDLSFLVTYYLIGYRKKVVRKNLINSFPTKATAEIRKIERTFYRHFTDLLFESAKFITVSKDDIKQRFELVNPEVFSEYFSQQKSIIMYTAHYGNWEWLAALPLSLQHRVVTFYQPLRSRYYEQLMKGSRERFGATAVPSGKGYKALIEFANRGEPTATCMIGDQSPKRKSSRHWVRFLHQDTAFLVGADRIARKANQPVFFPHMRKISRGRYQVEMILLTDKPNEATPEDIIEKYAATLERAINEAPHLWLWSHKRWKTKKEVV